MPLYNYKCGVCGKGQRRLCTPAEAETAPLCCETPMARIAKGVSSRTVEIMDSMAMTHPVERLADADRLFRERARATEKDQAGDP